MVSGAYKGKMHRLKNAPPRQWPMPSRSLTVEQFSDLTRRRDQQQNANPNFEVMSEEKTEEGESKEREAVGAIPDDKDNGSAANFDGFDAHTLNVDGKVKVSKVSEVNGSNIRTNDGKVETTNTDGNVKVSNASEVKESGIRTNDEKAEVVSTWIAEKEQRRLEAEKKLVSAKEKKHNLVQMLKMILNTEEELKRRIAQSAATRAWVPTQSETTVDMGSASRLVPKLSVEVNFSGEQGTETDATACHSSHGQQITKPFMQNTARSSFASSGAATTCPSGFVPSPGAAGGASVSNFKATCRSASSS